MLKEDGSEGLRLHGKPYDFDDDRPVAGAVETVAIVVHPGAVETVAIAGVVAVVVLAAARSIALVCCFQWARLNMLFQKVPILSLCRILLPQLLNGQHIWHT